MNHALVAKAMCKVTEELLWKPRIEWALKHNPTADLKLRVGSGEKTYLSHRRDVDKDARMTLTFGSKMVASKTNPVELGNWRTGKEVGERGYYGGEVTLLNVLAHTMAHEFGHFVQVVLGRRYSGSVHNPEFYTVLDRIHAKGEGDRIRAALHERCLIHNIDLMKIGAIAQASSEPVLTMRDIRRGQELWFRDPSLHCHNPVRVIKKNRTRIVVQGVQDSRRSWSAPPAVFKDVPDGH